MTLSAETIRTTTSGMLCFTTRHSSTPSAIRGRFEMQPHQSDDILVLQTKLIFNRFEGCSVLPSHLNHAIDLTATKTVQRSSPGGCARSEEY